MKSPVNIQFDEWLTMMEVAYQNLSKKEFRELEEKIKKEIRFHRRAGRDGKG